MDNLSPIPRIVELTHDHQRGSFYPKGTRLEYDSVMDDYKVLGTLSGRFPKDFVVKYITILFKKIS